MMPAQLRAAAGRPRTTAAATGLALLVLCAANAGAQSIAERVRRVGDGTVRLAYAARPDVCGDGAGTIGYDDGRRTIRRTGNVSWERGWGPDDCVGGPVRAALAVRSGVVTRVRVTVGGWRSEGGGGNRRTDRVQPPASDLPPAVDSVVDLGVVPAAAAADYFLGLAEGSDERAGTQAVLAATLADSAVVWPRLLRLARDERRPRATRRDAAFWVAQAAADRVAGSTPAARDESDDADVRRQVVFALSQRPRDESVPALVRIARTNRDPDVRRTALFWLGQSGDPRALDLFEELLR